MLPLLTREFLSFFRTPIGWVVAALYLLLAGAVVSTTTIVPGEPASLRVFFATSQWLLLIVCPAISMRLLAEEFRTGSIELLRSSPPSDWAAAGAKYLAAVLVLVAILAPTVAYPLVLARLADPDLGPILTGYAGLLLVGALYLAVGLFFSSLTQNQTVAFLATLFFFLLLWFASSAGAAAAPEPFDGLLYTLSISLRLSDFAKGVLEVEHAVFFLAGAALFVALAAISLESRRWR